MKMILTSECEECRYGTIDESSRARVKVICSLKGREYYYGQYVPCDSKIKKADGGSNEENSGIC